MPAAPQKPDEPREPTRRLVLKRTRVIVIPDGAMPEQVEEAVRALPHRKKGDDAATGEAWVIVDEQEGSSKLDSIEAYAGKAGTPDARPGVYRAIALSAWRGLVEYVKPPEPKIERSVRDE